MMNKLRLFGSEMKYSIKFIMTAIIEISLCILMLNMGFTFYEVNNYQMQFYSKSVADYNYVDFSGGTYYGDLTVEALAEIIDLKDLATVADLGKTDDSKYLNIFLTTPLLYEKFNKLSFTKELRNYDGVYEAYVADSAELQLNKEYKIEFVDSNNIERSITIKPVEFITEDFYYYSCSSYIDIAQYFSSNKIMIMGELQDFTYAAIYGGTLINDNPKEMYTDLGFTTHTIQERYDLLKERNISLAVLPLAIAVTLMIFSCASIMILYLINVSNASRTRAVNYMFGVSPIKQSVIEILKMILVFVIPLAINYPLAVWLGSKEIYNKMDINYLKVDNFLISAAIMLGIYLISVFMGLIKYFKQNAILIINNEH